MFRNLRALLVFPLIVLLAACGNSVLNGGGTGTNVSESILQRLNEEGSFVWVEDRFAAITESSVENIYTTEGCSVWVFPNESEVTQINSGDFFNFYEGEVWYGVDSYSPKGVTLLTETTDSPCAQVVFKLLNWSIEEENDTSQRSSSLSGTWGSDSWMYDNVGMFLKIKEVSKNQYIGNFYSQGQSGGIFKDITVDITDIGDGMAEVVWPSGNTTIATWGKRDKNTEKDVDPNWKGDIWFDCLGELDYAESRADCNFYLAN